MADDQGRDPAAPVLNAGVAEALEVRALLEHRVVGAAEADPDRRRISVESPVGEALVGRVAGDVMEVGARIQPAPHVLGAS